MKAMMIQLHHAVRSPRLKAAATVLLLLLQRTPVLKVLVETELRAVVGIPQLLRSAVVAATALGAVDTVTGATTFVSNPSSPTNATVGEEFGLVFSIIGSESAGGGAGSWTIEGPLPPGLTIVGATEGPTDTFKLNSGSGGISGTPTEEGTWDVTFTAWEKPQQNGESWDTEKLGALPVVRIVVSSGDALVFTSQPMSAEVEVGRTFNLGVTTSGSPAPTLQWRKNRNPIDGATGEIFSIQSVTLDDAGEYDVVATNSNASVTSDAATLTVTAKPVITTQPVAQQVMEGGTATFTVEATGAPAPTYVWRRNGLAIPGADGPSLVIDPVSTTDAGTYTVFIQNATGSVTSDPVDLTLESASGPEIQRQPQAQTVVPGGGATFQVDAGQDEGLSFQWRKDGVDLPGATGATLDLSQVQVSDAGIYTVVVSSGGASTESAGALLSISGSGQSRLANLSTRTRINEGGTLIPGFVVEGSGQAPVLIRAVGPTLGSLGVTGTLPDPEMRLVSNGVEQTTNDDWGQYPDQSDLEATRQRVGAFALDAGSADAALVVSLDSGPHTVPTTGAEGTSGVVLVELYDAGVGGTEAPRLVNLSARSQVGTGSDLLIPGFVIQGDVAKTVLIRAVGPTLGDFGVQGALEDPVMSLYSGTQELATNDDWGDGEQAAAIIGTAARVGAFAISETSRDSALLITLNPGAYTVQVAGVDDTTGECLVEVYDVPPE